MHKITFYPIGNSDCCMIDLDGGKKLMFDFAHYAKAEDDKDPRIHLAVKIREDLNAAGRDNFDVVGFTHGDDDHIHGFSEFFYLEHAKKYQGDDRIKIQELWVPAAMVIDGDLKDEAKILRAEARYRLKNGKGIRVFSRPERLKSWLEGEGIKFDDRKSLITDAGKIVPGFSKDSEGIEFFVHSPFATHVDDETIDRNESSLIFQATFSYKGQDTKFILIGDTTHEVLTDIIDITKFHKNEDRLEWDIFDVPHHCSYLALNSEKGTDKTQPVENVAWLLENGNEGGIIVSCSNPIPADDGDNQPPHRQAANYYKEVASTKKRQFKVTMEHPKVSNPTPLVILIDDSGATLEKKISGAAAVVTSRPAPRAGCN